MEEIFHWYSEAIRRRGDFEGRSRRMEYWTFSLVNAVAFTIAQTFASVIASSVSRGLGVALFIVIILVAVAMVYPGLSLSIRRLHDIGKSGWWILIALVPIVGPIVLLVFSFMDSTPGENQYGPNPKGM